jgi:hypothetical protein
MRTARLPCCPAVLAAVPVHVTGVAVGVALALHLLMRTLGCDLAAPQEEVGERGLSVAPGRAAREALFMLDPDVAYLNHGSFGASFRSAAPCAKSARRLLLCP